MTRFLLVLKTLEAIFETILKMLFYTIIIYVCWKSLAWILVHW